MNDRIDQAAKALVVIATATLLIQVVRGLAAM